MPLFFQFKLQANMEAFSVLIMAIISVLRVNTNVTSFILADVIRLPLDSSGVAYFRFTVVIMLMV